MKMIGHMIRCKKDQWARGVTEWCPRQNKEKEKTSLLMRRRHYKNSGIYLEENTTEPLTLVLGEKRDCVDGSDEEDLLCNRTGASPTTAATAAPVTTTTTPAQSLTCRLPAQPAHGRYTVAGRPGARPGQSLESFYLNYTCSVGYGIVGESTVYCFRGYWSVDTPRCVSEYLTRGFCRLHPHPSVEYMCPVPDTNGGTRPCNRYEPDGTRVIPNCRSPNYYSPQALSRMTCIEGSWDYIATCLPECGRETPNGQVLIIDGRAAERGELPWHVGVYRKDARPYLQICGGSIISTTVVVSAAHCFWSESAKRSQPPSMYVVAAGKLYRPWNNPRDVDAQMSEVAEIKVPTSFRGAQNNYQSDIALVVLSTPIVYQTYVRPVCVDFDVYFNSRQLMPGRLGKVAGWGYTSENATSSPTLQVVDLPYLNFSECLVRVPEGFREYITSDKICAGYTNGTALCRGDSGGGLVFPENERGVTRYYLRGVVSTAPNNANACNAYAITSFTQITWHEHFIKENFATIPL
ncbi:Modular serine protease [Eumeta japonica]|uniref:Modular serine protease n=1 Tax=Eumeta variegata TaxID=151549 RepID=A0A4C1VE94_EUMVA|nr:Modular serine protease [Eumeta japonica]